MTSDRERAQRAGRALDWLMGRVNLRPSELARRSGVSATTIGNILRGHDDHERIHLAHPDTLRRIATGLATDRDGYRNADAEHTNYQQLMVAAGYMDALGWPKRLQELIERNRDLARVTVLNNPADLWDDELIDAVEDVFRRRRAERDASGSAQNYLDGSSLSNGSRRAAES